MPMARPFCEAAITKPSGRSGSSHLGIAQQHDFKVFRNTTGIHLLEVLVPTGRGHLPLKFALKFDVRHTIDAKEIVRSTTIGLGRVHAIGNDVDTGRLQTFDRFDYFLREIGSFAFGTFGPGRTVVIKLDKDLLHDATLLDAERKHSSLARADAIPVACHFSLPRRSATPQRGLDAEGQRMTLAYRLGQISRQNPR